MIVTSLIAMLAASALAAFQRVSIRAQASAYFGDVRVFSEGFGRHAQEKGAYPAAGTPGQVPPGMTDYLRESNWQKRSPIGGQYEWIDKDTAVGLGLPYNAAIRVAGCTWTMDQLRLLDGWFDDGNLSTGSFAVADAGTTVYFVIERSSL